MRNRKFFSFLSAAALVALTVAAAGSALAEENTLPSFHEKIRIAQVREYDYAQVEKDIDELVEIAKQFDNMATVKKMKEIVPEYKSNNSVYEVLDK